MGEVIESDGDIIIDANRDGGVDGVLRLRKAHQDYIVVDEAGDIAFRTNNVERARIKADGTGTGWPSVLGGSITYVGAASGDTTGVTDLAAIQAAITARAAAGGGTVDLPAGTFIVNNTIHLSSYVTLRGASRAGTVIKFANGVGSTINMIDLLSARQEQICVKDVTLHGNSVGQHGIYLLTDSNTNGAFTSGLANARQRLENVLARNFGGNGFHLAGDTKAGLTEVIGCQAYFNTGRGFYTLVPDTVFTDCDAGQSGLHGFEDAAGWNRFVGCKSWLSGRVDSTNGSGYRVSGAGYTSFAGCEAQDNQQHGFQFFGRTAIVATGLRADTNSKASAGTYFGIGMQNATDCVIEVVGFDRRGDSGTDPIVQQYVIDMGGATKNIVIAASGQNSNGAIPAAQINSDNAVIATGVGVGALGLMTSLQLARATPTYSASITPDGNAGPWQTIVVTNSTAFTINAIGNAPGSGQTREVTIEISNTSGGAMGAITWNAAFKLVGGAFTNPATGNKRFIRFEWNGTNWIETSRAAADYT